MDILKTLKEQEHSRFLDKVKKDPSLANIGLIYDVIIDGKLASIKKELFDLMVSRMKELEESIEDGEEGAPGKTPTEEELVALIKPLIPKIRDGVDGKDGTNPDIKGIVKEVLSKIPRPHDGKTPIAGIDFNIPNDGKDGDNGKDGSPDTPIQIVDKLNTLENVLNPEVIKGFWDIIKRLQSSLREKGGGQVGGGGGSLPFQLVSSSTTIGENVGVVLADASAGPITITLPFASQAARREYHIKKIDSTVNMVTILPRGSETIDGETSVIFDRELKASFRLYSDGRNYYII